MSVSLSVTLVSAAKTAEPIEMPFGLRTWMCPRNHMEDGGPDAPVGKGNFSGKRRPCYSIDTSAARELCKHG